MSLLEGYNRDMDMTSRITCEFNIGKDKLSFRRVKEEETLLSTPYQIRDTMNRQVIAMIHFFP
jgi:hypothetical protein